jgi:hypothetical protein
LAAPLPKPVICVLIVVAVLAMVIELRLVQVSLNRLRSLGRVQVRVIGDG